MKEKNKFKFIHALLIICVISIVVNVRLVQRFESIRRGYIHGIHLNMSNIHVLAHDFTSSTTRMESLIEEIRRMQWNLRAFQWHHYRNFLISVPIDSSGRISFRPLDIDMGRAIQRYLCEENEEYLASLLELQNEYILDFILRISIDEGENYHANVHALRPNERLSTRQFFSEFNSLIEGSVNNIWFDFPTDNLVPCPIICS